MNGLTDLIAARTHLQEALPRLTGQNLADAKALIASLTTLIKKAGKHN